MIRCRGSPDLQHGTVLVAGIIRRVTYWHAPMPYAAYGHCLLELCCCWALASGIVAGRACFTDGRTLKTSRLRTEDREFCGSRCRLSSSSSISSVI
jgi:hypothetical protein